MSLFFGHHSVLISYSSLHFDLSQLSPEIARYGSIDQVAIELERMGSGSALEIRTNTLRDIGQRMWRDYNDPVKAMEWLATQSPRIGLWAACAVARTLLERAPESHRAACEAGINGIEKMFASSEDLHAMLAAFDSMRTFKVDGLTTFVRIRVMAAMKKLADAAVIFFGPETRPIRELLVGAIEDARKVFPPMYEDCYARDYVWVMAKALPGMPADPSCV